MKLAFPPLRIGGITFTGWRAPAVVFVVGASVGVIVASAIRLAQGLM